MTAPTGTLRQRRSRHTRSDREQRTLPLPRAKKTNKNNVNKQGGLSARRAESGVSLLAGSQYMLAVRRTTRHKKQAKWMAHKYGRACCDSPPRQRIERETVWDSPGADNPRSAEIRTTRLHHDAFLYRRGGRRPSVTLQRSDEAHMKGRGGF